MAFDDERPAPGPHAGPRLPLEPEVAMGVARELSSESVGRLISMLELAFVLVHRVPDGSSYSETSRHYARAAHLRLVGSRLRRSHAPSAPPTQR